MIVHCDLSEFMTAWTLLPNLSLHFEGY